MLKTGNMQDPCLSYHRQSAHSPLMLIVGLNNPAVACSLKKAGGTTAVTQTQTQALTADPSPDNVLHPLSVLSMVLYNLFPQQHDHNPQSPLPS